ncbi:hypothetical protein KUL49_36260 [Alteromonas sp. KUL49]|nr:hypothetical protein KUL49_36260 [Alteromonas sp. KUL49]
MFNAKRTLVAAIVGLTLVGCSNDNQSENSQATQPTLTQADAKAFLAQAQAEIAKM